MEPCWERKGNWLLKKDREKNGALGYVLIY